MQIRDQACGVMLEPFAGLGIDSASSKVRSFLSCKNETLRRNSLQDILEYDLTFCQHFNS